MTGPFPRFLYRPVTSVILQHHIRHVQIILDLPRGLADRISEPLNAVLPDRLPVDVNNLISQDLLDSPVAL